VIQCASIFIPTGTYTGVDRKEAIQTEYDRVVSVYKRELNANPKELYRVLTRRDIPDIRQNDKMQDVGTGILLTIEDGGVMGGEMQKLYRAYEDGVRLVTLT
jgi:membrane dipeptidase